MSWKIKVGIGKCSYISGSGNLVTNICWHKNNREEKCSYDNCPIRVDASQPTVQAGALEDGEYRCQENGCKILVRDGKIKIFTRTT